jgi:hypothetical protein
VIAPARFTIELACGMRLSLTLYPLTRDHTSSATLAPTASDAPAPIFCFFSMAECRLVPAAVDSPYVLWALWLGNACIDVTEAEATNLQGFIASATAGDQGGA